MSEQQETRPAIWEELQQHHAAQKPRERRAYSWSRTVAFAQEALSKAGHHLRRGTDRDPFVVWVLNASSQTEGFLAENGYFSDANWSDRAACEVVLCGHTIRDVSAGPVQPAGGAGPRIRAATYDRIASGGSPGRPDMVAVLMP
eukprot:CAMPEP_0179291932 /NCGR_PEP_ID=MMETSP0797-20121207/42593_1 /TAXON_ID=47934 /ORGANISM="Dinophysis acuminata, Strain DAEP01" /LENGTH=143 /DNA_ID=CAMNT_0021001025 /DNA_START=122 /DNA_END=549 /DNA_ORIENTATION=+